MNLPAHVDWSARRRLALNAAARRFVALLAGFAFLLGMFGAGHLLATAAEAFERDHAPTPVPTLAAVVTSTPTPLPTKTPTPPPTPTPTPLPPDYVARVRMPSLGIDHYVIRLGVINNQMQSPDADGVRAIGWYPEFATPGRGGNAVFSAHETWEFQHGPFYALRQAKPGDEVTIDMTSGARYRYVVTSNRRYDANAIPMGEIIWPSTEPPGEEWATFITCGGRFVATGPNGLGEYLDRDVVVARRVT